MKKYPPRASANSTTTATIQVRRDTWRSSDGVSLVVFGGGIIPEEDRQALAELGVSGIFTPGARMDEIVDWVRANVRRTPAL